MTPRDERHLNRLTVAALIGVLTVAVLGHMMPEPVPDVQTVTAERGVDYQRIAQRNGRRFAECHADLVRAQTRLRQLGHQYSEEAHGWVRVR